MENQTSNTEVKVNGAIPADMAAAFAADKAKIETIKAKATEAEIAMAAEIAKLRAENEGLRKAKATNGKLSLKVSEKGALSVYGMGRFPVTLYREQWERLLAHEGEIKAFIKANGSGLKLKSDE